MSQLLCIQNLGEQIKQILQMVQIMGKQVECLYYQITRNGNKNYQKIFIEIILLLMLKPTGYEFELIIEVYIKHCLKHFIVEI
jgi:hypothetical protein